MANVGKIFGITALIAVVSYAGYKGVSFWNKVKQASGNITFDASFLRIHGLVGEGITKFVSPTIRTIFNLKLKNFSGFDIEVNKIFARIETNKAGSNTWTAIATSIGFGHNSLYTEGYLTINLKDGKTDNYTIHFDFKGLGTITSLITKTNRHRIVLTYNYKGQQLEFTKDVDLTSPINSFWQKAQSKFNSLRGTDSNILKLVA